jgi:hypothetical protein
MIERKETSRLNNKVLPLFPQSSHEGTYSIRCAIEGDDVVSRGVGWIEVLDFQQRRIFPI